MPDMGVVLGSLRLKNPVLTASGTFGYGTEYSAFYDVSRLGGIITKTITLEPRKGNPLPRLAETPAGMLNSIGLANVGVERFLAEKLEPLKNADTTVIVNVAGNFTDEYRRVVARIEAHCGTDAPVPQAYEINVSCPNVKQGGLAFGTDPGATEAVVKAVRSETDRPLIVKLTPNVTDIRETARAAEAAGADCVSLINTVLGMAVDIETRMPVLARGIGGLSGPAVKPIALARVYQTVRAVSIPVIGIGGIMSWSDALEFLITGASAVQIGSMSFIDPGAALHVAEGLETYCLNQGISRITDLIGTLREHEA